jgi:hypothetical protein
MFFTGSVTTLAIAIVACGGSSAAPPGSSTDAGGGGDGTTTQGGDSGGIPTDASLLDTADAFVDLFTATPPDAALNDAGASVGTCLSCAQTKCEADVAACNADQACDSVFACAFNCISEIGGTFAGCYLQCGGSLTSGGADPTETALGKCALQQCPTECAVCSISAKLCPTDAGTPVDSGETDTGTDAPSDATGE